MNSIYLAQKNPTVNFIGVDLSDAQLSFAFQNANKVNNYHPQKGDFNHLEKFADNSFDVIFVIEALCHSPQKDKVLPQIRRILKKDGVFIVFDGYSRRKTSDLSIEELQAKELVERGLALSNFDNYKEFTKMATEARLKVMYEEDLTNYLYYTLNKFERLAKMFFYSPVLATGLKKVLPKEITYNTVTGFLLPLTIQLDIHCYYITVLQK